MKKEIEVVMSREESSKVKFKNPCNMQKFEGKMKEMLDMFVKLKKKGMSLHLNQMKSQYKKAMKMTNIKAPQMVNSNNRLNSAIKNPFDQPNTQQSNVTISFNFV